ncbi:hypothetical protein [Brevundimonas diminuta]|uniref:DUF1440 domain-containing protein n=1 Tax=Brevundimonas diminuta TaxID=293 RepID=A0A1Z3LVJ0_BREDI|nr:hypothetical protein [Brevundimonas diminuta]ASD26232.1 hypothetical protein CD943_04605 [Brevundimonas diminuta]
MVSQPAHSCSDDLPERRILVASLLAGAVDLGYALGINAASGVPPIRVLQYIASGLMGTSAFHGEGGSAAIGLAVHFGLMALFAGGVAFAMHGEPRLARHPWLTGVLGGLVLYIVMTFVAVPLSYAPPLPPASLFRQVAELAVHVAVVGPIVAFCLLNGCARKPSPSGRC